MSFMNRKPINQDGQVVRSEIRKLAQDQQRMRGYETGGFVETSQGRVSMPSGGGISAGFLSVIGLTGDQANLWDATLQGLVPGQLQTTPGQSVWAWAIMGLPLSVTDAHGNPAFYFWVQNGSRSAVPHAGGPAILRPLYVVIGGCLGP